MKRMTDPRCKLCMNIIETHKSVLLQFQLLSGMFINPVLKIITLQLENVYEIRVSYNSLL